MIFENNKKWPQYTDNMIEGVSEILRSGKVNQWTGHYVRQFENEFASYFNQKHAVAVSNGTTALELALIALDIKEGDEVIVTARSFVASASCILLRKAIPVFADVDPLNQNTGLKAIQSKITSKTKAVILVHLTGVCTEDLEEIVKWCHENGIYLIEDCAQCHGAKFKDQYLGSFGDIACWSFCQDKIISTGGEGGMVTTNNLNYFKIMWSYKDHGKNYDLWSDNSHMKINNYRFTHDFLGNNYRMTEIQALIGIESLKLLEEWIRVRNRNAETLRQRLSTINQISIYQAPSHIKHAYYKFYFHIKKDFLIGSIRDQIVENLNAKGIPASIGSCGRLYDEAVLLKYKREECLVSEQLMKNSIMLLVDPTYNEEKINQVADLVYETLTKSFAN